MKILIAGEDAPLRASTGFFLSQEGFEIVSASSYEEALTSIKRDAIEFLLLDMNLAEPGALQLCRAVRRASNAPIMILAARDSEDELVDALEAGADDYVRKPFSPRALVARVRALARRAQPARVSTIAAGLLQLDLDEHVLRIGTKAQIRLTPMELKAVQLLVSAPGRTVSSEKLSAHLWGHEGERERHTLKQLIYRLRGKLDTAGAAGLLRTTPGSGYKLLVEHEDLVAPAQQELSN
jgi:DNA-binding response OmpR family regulator